MNTGNPFRSPRRLAFLVYLFPAVAVLTAGLVAFYSPLGESEVVQGHVVVTVR